MYKTKIKSLFLVLVISILANASTALAAEEDTNTTSEPVSCSYDLPDKANYRASFISVRRKFKVEPNQLFETKVYIKNTGNVPWFSAESGCDRIIARLGTDNPRDRESPFFPEELIWTSGWSGVNRIDMTTKRVNPGEVAIFSFWSAAPQTEGYYREYYTPLIESIQWMDSARFSTDVTVGEPQFDPKTRENLTFIEESAELSKLALNGEKSIHVDISSQRMQLKIGEYTIKTFPVSTGTYRTPTPYGTTYISHKQSVRVSGAWPHYIMPQWMTFRASGYGIHALPSISYDNGRYWHEALNHIGTRRSHGCIRLLPEDAKFAYKFADIGTKVVVQP
ncbi:L,D-transpeptidase family protein [Pseudomonadota bacterium]